MTETSQNGEAVARLEGLAVNLADYVSACVDARYWGGPTFHPTNPMTEERASKDAAAITKVLTALSEAEERVKALDASCREQFAIAKHNADACNDLTQKNNRLREAVEGYQSIASQARAERDTALARIAELERPETPQEYVARMTRIDTDAIRGDLGDGRVIDGATVFALVDAYEALLARIAGLTQAHAEETYAMNSEIFGLEDRIAGMEGGEQSTDLQLEADMDQLGARVIDDWIDSEPANVSEFFNDDYAAGSSLKVAVSTALLGLARSYATPAAALARAERAEEVKTAWVLQRNNLPYTVYFDEAEAQGECVRQREADAKWCEKNKHAADVRTYWNVYKTVRAAKPEGLR